MDSKNNITRKEWRRNKRRATYLRKKEGRLNAKAKNEAIEKRYDIHAQYHETLSSKVRNIIEKNKIKYAILTDYFFICSNLSKEECDALQEKFKDCVISRPSGRGSSHIKFSKWKSKTIVCREKTSHTHTNNIKEAKCVARANRKAKNIAKHPKFIKHTTNEKKKSTKENPIPIHGRKAKIIAYRHAKHKFKSTAKVVSALKETTLEKKLRQRAQKAGQYLIKQEKKASITPTKTSKSKKSIQQKFKFAA